MSVRVISDVLTYSRSKGTARLVLIALADVANDQGEVSAYRRSQAILARKANCKVDTVRLSVKALIELGELVVVKPGGGWDSADYRITLTPPENGSPRERGTPPRESGDSPPENPPLSPRDGGAISPSLSVSTPSESVAPSPDAEAVDVLCRYLADRVGSHRGARPPITAAWKRDMRLLLNRGPLHSEDATPMPASRIRATIDTVFTHMAEPAESGFCWADQIRSPYALRDHWLQMATQYQSRLRAARAQVRRDPLALPEDFDGLRRRDPLAERPPATITDITTRGSA